MTVSFDFRFLPNLSRHQSFSVYDVSICVLSHVLVSRWTLRNKKMHEGKSLQYTGVWFIAFSQANCPSMLVLLAEGMRFGKVYCIVGVTLDRETKEKADAVLSSPIS